MHKNVSGYFLMRVPLLSSLSKRGKSTMSSEGSGSFLTETSLYHETKMGQIEASIQKKWSFQPFKEMYPKRADVRDAKKKLRQWNTEVGKLYETSVNAYFSFRAIFNGIVGTRFHGVNNVDNHVKRLKNSGVGIKPNLRLGAHEDNEVDRQGSGRKFKIIMGYLVKISKKARILELKRRYFEDYCSDNQYVISIKEDTAYLCLHSPKDHKGNKINTSYP
ncbi:hypothetical protein Tco_1139789 [Tanacetum coccineum]